jgi:hypothetical protein
MKTKGLNADPPNPPNPPDPPDLTSFLYGMLAGGLITLMVEAVVLYFTWPYIVSALGALGAVKK